MIKMHNYMFEILVDFNNVKPLFLGYNISKKTEVFPYLLPKRLFLFPSNRTSA